TAANYLIYTSGNQLRLKSSPLLAGQSSTSHAVGSIAGRIDNDDLGTGNSQRWILSNGASRKCVSPAIQLNRPCAACLPSSRHRKHRPSRRELARPSLILPEFFLRYQGRS